MSPKRSNAYRERSTQRVCIVGAGLSGVCAAIQLKRKLGYTNFVIFEKEHDVGGVWLTSRYPGCQVQSPSLMYSYSFAQNPGWSQLFADRDEMWAYIKDTASKSDIYRHVEFRTVVDSLVWNEGSSTWTVTTTSITTKEQLIHEFDIVILGTGLFNTPHYPSEFESFSGPKMHSADWDSNINLENQVVGVVGTSASGVQIVPSIAPKVKKLIVYLREPNHVLPKTQLPLWWIFKFLFSLLPCLLWTTRAIGYWLLEFVLASVGTVGSFQNKAVSLVTELQIWGFVKDKGTRELLKPRYEAGYKIPAVMYSSYYQAYNRPNVHLNKSPVSRIEGQNVVTEDGRVERLDVLILCTGFKVLDFFFPIRVTGAGGVDLLKLWKANSPATFYGVTCAEAPNLFFLAGPNTAAPHLVFIIECQVNFILNALRELTKRNAASIRVRASAQAESMREIREAEKNKVYIRSVPPGVSKTWLGDQNGHGVIWPTSSTNYWLRTRRLDPSKFEFSGRKDEISDKYRPLTAEDVV